MALFPFSEEEANFNSICFVLGSGAYQSPLALSRYLTGSLEAPGLQLCACYLSATGKRIASLWNINFLAPCATWDRSLGCGNCICSNKEIVAGIQ